MEGFELLVQIVAKLFSKARTFKKFLIILLGTAILLGLLIYLEIYYKN